MRVMCVEDEYFWAISAIKTFFSSSLFVCVQRKNLFHFTQNYNGFTAIKEMKRKICVGTLTKSFMDGFSFQFAPLEQSYTAHTDDTVDAYDESKSSPLKLALVRLL